ncbi:hypothetical protein MDA_GLEAN10012774 [Myotis davidii]|uniref:Uncharacterized protein n=1 Tax=Myotis davidii TaxID=225400 RepID=L5LKG3_MYODS|nr:hypothetical protein MDA_GLEAN10012774 [Myotis davidii]
MPALAAPSTCNHFTWGQTLCYALRCHRLRSRKKTQLPPSQRGSVAELRPVNQEITVRFRSGHRPGLRTPSPG